jgi:hypothetical protein
MQTALFMRSAGACVLGLIETRAPQSQGYDVATSVLRYILYIEWSFLGSELNPKRPPLFKGLQLAFGSVREGRALIK